MAFGVKITALGHYLPATRVTNADLETRLGLEPGWIMQRTGIEERRYARKDEALSDLAVAAGVSALEKNAVVRANIGLVILATSTPDHPLPPSAPLVAHRLGLDRAGAIDMAGACSGFLYALSFADAHVRRTGDSILIIAANILSRRTNPDDRASVILFGDGAGAIVLGPDDHPGRGVVGTSFASDGGSYDLIKIAMGGSRQPFEPSGSSSRTFMKIADGKKVFSKAVAMMEETSVRALQDANLPLSKVDAFVPHQANRRMIDALAKKLGIPEKKVATSIAHFANSSAATIPITLSHTNILSTVQDDGHILMCAAGAGLTAGAVVLRT